MKGALAFVYLTGSLAWAGGGANLGGPQKLIQQNKEILMKDQEQAKTVAPTTSTPTQLKAIKKKITQEGLKRSGSLAK